MPPLLEAKSTKMKQKLYLILFAVTFVCALLVFSCTKEDFSKCPKDLRVYFSLTNPQSNPEDVDRMHLYVFNDRGYFQDEYRDDRITHFSPDYYMTCSNLLSGKYRFIAWAGKDENHYATTPASFVKDKTTFEEALLTLKHPGGLVSTPQHTLFHSDLPVTVVNEKGQRFYMPLSQITNTIHISTVGLPTDDNAYLFYIVDNNCTYSFDNSFASHLAHSVNETFTYTTSCTKAENRQLNASLQVMRLAANRRVPRLEIYNKTAGKALYPVGDQSGDLIGLILRANPQNNFETTHTYDIILHFSGDESTGFKVSITINGWEVKEQDNELND